MNARRSLLLFGLIVAIGAPDASAAPPKKKQRDREPVAEGLERVGNFFFRIARKLEQTGFPEIERTRDSIVIYDSDREPRAEVRVHPSAEYYYYGTGPGVTARIEPVRPPYGSRVYGEPYAPRYQPDLRAGVVYPDRQPEENGRSSLTIPVDPRQPAPSDRILRPLPPGYEDPRMRPQQPLDPPAPTAPQTKRPREDTDAPAEKQSAPKAPTPPSGELEFATPVPGKPGFVYPPGAAHDTKSMLDVRDFAPAQKVRDPRSGQMFLVPPK